MKIEKKCQLIIWSRADYQLVGNQIIFFITLLTRHSRWNFTNERHSDELTACTDPCSILCVHIHTSTSSSQFRVPGGEISVVGSLSSRVIPIAIRWIRGEAEATDPDVGETGLGGTEGDGTVVLEKDRVTGIQKRLDSGDSEGTLKLRTQGTTHNGILGSDECSSERSTRHFGFSVFRAFIEDLNASIID